MFSLKVINDFFLFKLPKTTETLVTEANQTHKPTVWAASSQLFRMFAYQHCEQDGEEYGIYWQEILQPELSQGTSFAYYIWH